jgi:hypothetical protein
VFACEPPREDDAAPMAMYIVPPSVDAIYRGALEEACLTGCALA